VSAGSIGPIPLGTTLVLRGAIVPSAVLSILLVFRHDSGRRILPALLPLPDPRRWGLHGNFEADQRQGGEETDGAGQMPPDSWLGRHYGGLQFGFGVSSVSAAALLFFNADDWCWLVGCCFTIACRSLWLSVRRAKPVVAKYFCSDPCKRFTPQPADFAGSKGPPPASSYHPVDVPHGCRAGWFRAERLRGHASEALQSTSEPKRMYWAALAQPHRPALIVGYVGW